jgi:predicted deacylase
MRQALADEAKGGVQHEPQDLVEPVDGELVHRCHVLHTGVVDQDVDVGRQVAEGSEVGQVGHPRADRLANVPSQSLQSGVISVDRVHDGAISGEGLRDSPADAAPGTSDKSRLA